jgi:hypothetical protein
MVLVFNVTFNNISAILWWSVLYLSVSVSGMSNTSQSIEADNSNQDMTMYENIPFPGQEGWLPSSNAWNHR